MRTFLIQTYNDKITDDFSFELIQAIEYQNWYAKETKFSYKTSETVKLGKHIPIGSVEFVSEFLERSFGSKPKPINIPESLWLEHFLGRTVIKVSGKQLISGKKFVKSNTEIKKFTEFVEDEILPIDEYIVSDIVDFFSEWRGFVYKGRLVGLQWYSGDFKKFPEVFKIEEMIHEFKEAPISYTIDVGVTINGTFLIECHDFFSCGLYGFNDKKILPQMFVMWYDEFRRKHE